MSMDSGHVTFQGERVKLEVNRLLTMIFDGTQTFKIIWNTCTLHLQGHKNMFETSNIVMEFLEILDSVEENTGYQFHHTAEQGSPLLSMLA